jgi:hypothetical protein
VDNFSFRSGHISTKTTTNKKTNLPHQASSAFASKHNRSGGGEGGKEHQHLQYL